MPTVPVGSIRTISNQTSFGRRSRPVSMTRPAVIALFVAFTVSGCLATNKTELLEIRLRQQEDRIATLQSQLESTSAELEAVTRQNRFLQERLAEQGGAPLLPEQADRLFRVTEIRINTLLSGGLEHDDLHGDDQLNVVLTPYDAQGEVVKVPAQVELELFDLATDGKKHKIGSWSFDVAQTATAWHRGLIGRGYQFSLEWQEAPRSEDVVLHAHMTTVDHRQFDTSAQLRIRPPTHATAETSESNGEGFRPRRKRSISSEHGKQRAVNSSPGYARVKSANRDKASFGRDALRRVRDNAHVGSANRDDALANDQTREQN